MIRIFEHFFKKKFVFPCPLFVAFPWLRVCVSFQHSQLRYKSCQRYNVLRACVVFSSLLFSALLCSVKRVFLHSLSQSGFNFFDAASQAIVSVCRVFVAFAFIYYHNCCCFRVCQTFFSIFVAFHTYSPPFFPLALLLQFSYYHCCRSLLILLLLVVFFVEFTWLSRTVSPIHVPCVRFARSNSVTNETMIIAIITAIFVVVIVTAFSLLGTRVAKLRLGLLCCVHFASNKVTESFEWR